MSRGYLRDFRQAATAPSDDTLAGNFTPDERAQINRLRVQFVLAPETYQFDINFRRLAFAYWLVQHGYLSEEIVTPHTAQVGADCGVSREDGI